MNLISIHYFVILILLIALSNLVNKKSLPYVVLVFSFYFYASFSLKYLAVLIYIIISSYLLSKRAYQSSKYYSAFSCLIILSPLLFIKSYILPFKDSSFLPLGISFFSLQAISYYLDVKKGILQAQSLFSTALYLSFFPQLVAGPIEKAHHLIDRLKRLRAPSKTRIYYSFCILLIAIFKKQVLAERLYDLVYFESSILSIILSTLCFGLYLYFDFSAYCQIARASALLFGIKITQNFKRPYFAPNLKSFWMRWHTSLRVFFIDYVYIPLGGKQSIFASFLVFLISSLWHGVGVGFLLWGAWHFCFYTLLKKANNNIIFTQILVFIAWYFFYQVNWNSVSSTLTSNYQFQSSHFLLFVLISLYFYWEYLEEFSKYQIQLMKQSYRPWFLFTILCLILFFGKLQNSIFLYYRF